MSGSGHRPSSGSARSSSTNRRRSGPGTPLPSRPPPSRSSASTAPHRHAAGITDTAGRGVHEARRTWASRLRRAVVPVELLQSLGRWEPPTVPLSHYSAVDQAALRAAAEMVSDGLS